MNSSEDFQRALQNVLHFKKMIWWYINIYREWFRVVRSKILKRRICTFYTQKYILGVFGKCAPNNKWRHKQPTVIHTDVNYQILKYWSSRICNFDEKSVLSVLLKLRSKVTWRYRLRTTEYELQDYCYWS